MSVNYQQKYATDLQRGLEYQDFVYELLSRFGINTVSYGSRLFQHIRGENKARMEIKFDSKRSSTGNLYIEIKERSHPSYSYTDGGIYREVTEYIIGDYEVVYRLPATTLRLLHKSGKYREIEIPIKTSVGFLLPESVGEKWAIAVYRPECAGEVASLAEKARGDSRLAKQEMAELLRAMKCDFRQGALFDG